MIPDPSEATAHLDRRLVAAVVRVSDPASALEVSELRLTPAGYRALEVQPGRPSPVLQVTGVCFGAVLGLVVLAALGCTGAFAWGQPIEGGTADDVPPPGWCACP